MATTKATKPEVTDTEIVEGINGRMQRIWELEFNKMNSTKDIREAMRKLQAELNEVEAPFTDEQAALQADIEAIMMEVDAKCTTIYGTVTHVSGYDKVTYDYKGLDEHILEFPGIEKFRKVTRVADRIAIDVQAISTL